jgi:hypothetical protein
MAKPQRDDIGILKTIWRKSAAGAWVIHDLNSIDLKPREGCEKNYFQIRNEVNLLTQRPGDVMENFFATFGGSEFLVRQSIVPIVAWNDGDDEVRCIGTGFFISASGLLLTAAHVLRDPVDERYTGVTHIGEGQFKLDDSLRYGVLIPMNPAMRNAPSELFNIDPRMRSTKWFMCPFEWAIHWGRDVESPLVHQAPEFKLELDIAVCKIRENTQLGGSYQPLNIGLHDLKLGDRAVAIGYPAMRNIRINANDDYQPELTVSVGTVTTVYPDNITEKQNPTPGPNFEFNAKIPGKMSGSPILVGGGILTKGVVSRSWQGENSATGCLIAPVMSLPLVSERSLLDMMRDGKEGIAQVHGAGI